MNYKATTHEEMMKETFAFLEKLNNSTAAQKVLKQTLCNNGEKTDYDAWLHGFIKALEDNGFFDESA
jgi:DNA-directed RNA polymerase specialized sigma54-like protein